jgi:hypothetical protein
MMTTRHWLRSKGRYVALFQTYWDYWAVISCATYAGDVLIALTRSNSSLGARLPEAAKRPSIASFRQALGSRHRQASQ